MKKLPKNPFSESALKWCVKNWDKIAVIGGENGFIAMFHASHGLVGAIQVQELIRRRAPLTGIKKQMAGIVRGKRTKKKVKK